MRTSVIALDLLSGLLAVVCAMASGPSLTAADQAAAPGAPAGTAVRTVPGADIRALFIDNCCTCHGATKQKGGLRLDAGIFVLKGGSSGPAIIAGDSAKSYLMARLHGSGGEPRMPEKGKGLSPEQIALVAAWIDAGAPWSDTQVPAAAVQQRHWAFDKPIRPRLPEVRNRATVRNPIDAFVQARLEQEGIGAAPEAEPETLIRRLSLDLTGLPPTLEDVAAFLAADKATRVDRAVDRLLASEHYGERWARSWLDQARYADTDGFNFDSPRMMWPYRDWVIAALNADMPFDRFTIEQIAGDLLPNATEGQRIASGFHRNTMKNTEGGVDPDEARWENLIDRTNTTAAVWLGSTLGCAQCHNHKYDPFTQRDYYSFLAFFDNCEETTLHLGSTVTDYDGKKKDLTALVFTEKAGHEARTFLHIRGAYVSRGEQVTASTPGFLPPFKESYPRNRLGLARWLVDPDNPLTARVLVNRVWEGYFGKGLVETSEDFGTQGSAPSHPGLLDWLAVELMESGWSLKHLHRLITTSATYRQSSHVSPGQLERDPYNRLLARSSRYRLEAELIHDNALAIAGLLSPVVGGPSVFPPAPLELGRLNNNKEGIHWTVSTGADRYRRGLYTFWRRTAPYATFANFDAPSRESCTLRRVRTNTPLQALSGLNDPALWEAAQALGRRMQAGSQVQLADHLAMGFACCTARAPGPHELASLVAAYGHERAGFASDAAATQAVCGQSIASPELAAFIMVANVLLNLDETITRE
jgi:mono/diheme cytochrome c family protein